MPNNPQSLTDLLIPPFITPTSPMDKKIQRCNQREIKPSHNTCPYLHRKIAMEE